MNTSDSERIASFLESKGFSLAKEIQEADLAIFNTCGIKQTAENRAYSMINNLRKSQSKVKSRKSKAIVMTGCLANRSDVQKRMKLKVDLFTEIKNFQESIFEINLLKKNKDIFSKENLAYLSIQPKHESSFQAYVPIMTGCNNFCSYCVVPHARGREVSRPANEIISEVKDLISKNYKHIILLGQNVNSYKSPQSLSSSPSGRGCRVLTTGEGTNFSQLLKKINSIGGKFWISFVSSHPKDMSDELIETVAKCKKVCEWIHLPVQAGDDAILAKMNRKYTKKHYLGRIKKIKLAFKKYKPDSMLSISSDIIVGFPGETNKQFLQSADVMEKSKFDMVFFGQFSPRPGTVAWKMKDNVSQEEKFRRENFLNDILKKATLANNKKYVGKTLEVLIEKEKDGFYFGKTRTQKNVKIISKKKLPIGEFVKVKIAKANIWNLEGNIR